MEGWIKIHRKLSLNSLWGCEPFTRGQAWVDLIMLANHKPGYFYVRGVKVDVDVGQVGWSERRLSERWKWSRTKLRKFLNDLEKEQQIRPQKDNVTQVITIVNYKEYQIKEPQSGPQKDHNKKYSIENIDSFSNYYNKILSFFPEIYRPDNKEKQDDWIDCLDKLYRLDELTPDSILQIVKWGREDEFWRKNFRSVLKLRRTDKDGIKYYVIFQEKMKEHSGSNAGAYLPLGSQETRR